MFNGHIDMDPLAYGWKYDPFEPHLEDGLLRGAGLFNMKGGIACMISATEAIRRSGWQPRGDIVLACVAGELQGGVGTVHMVDNGVRADMAIVPEPYGAHNAITKHSGWTQLAISTIGFSHHVTLKEQAIDAIEKMMTVIPALKSIEFRHTPSKDLPLMPRLSVGCIIGGRGKPHDLTGPNYISDYCTILVDVRFLPGQTPETVEEDIAAVLAGLQEADPELEYEVEHPPPADYRTLRVSMDPFDVSEDEEIVRTVSEEYSRITGKAPHVGTHIPLSMGGDDCCHLWRAGIPSVLYGPGGLPITKEDPHDVMDTREMFLAAQVMALTAARVCQ
nr:M20/M25/M40 family metallo-hydrolase [Nocardioides agariphilus]